MTPYFLEAQEGLLTPSFFLTLLTPGVFPEHIPVGSHFPRGEPLISRVLEAESHCSFPIAPSLQGSCWQGDALHTLPSLARARGREEPVLAQTRPLCSVAASAACLPPPHPTPSLLLPSLCVWMRASPLVSLFLIFSLCGSIFVLLVLLCSVLGCVHRMSGLVPEFLSMMPGLCCPPAFFTSEVVGYRACPPWDVSPQVCSGEGIPHVRSLKGKVHKDEQSKASILSYPSLVVTPPLESGALCWECLGSRTWRGTLALGQPPLTS